MGLRITEINQHAVAEIFRKITFVLGNDLGARILKSADDFAQIFRINTPESAVESTRSQNITVN